LYETGGKKKILDWMIASLLHLQSSTNSIYIDLQVA
jgi:hypothetical protein